MGGRITTTLFILPDGKCRLDRDEYKKRKGKNETHSQRRQGEKKNDQYYSLSLSVCVCVCVMGEELKTHFLMGSASSFSLLLFYTAPMTAEATSRDEETK